MWVSSIMRRKQQQRSENGDGKWIRRRLSNDYDACSMGNTRRTPPRCSPPWCSIRWWSRGHLCVCYATTCWHSSHAARSRQPNQGQLGYEGYEIEWEYRIIGLFLTILLTLANQPQIITSSSPLTIASRQTVNILLAGPVQLSHQLVPASRVLLLMPYVLPVRLGTEISEISQ